MTDPVRVLHFNDCANVARNLVEAAARRGIRWELIPPEQVRPASPGSRAAWLPYELRRLRALIATDVVHVHYATSVPMIQRPLMPRRPYLLHLHGSDIRTQWPDPAWHDSIQAAIDGAVGVFYTNLDTVGLAEEARGDARYMPPFVDFSALPPRAEADRRGPVIRFASRWDTSKNATQVLAFARALRAAAPDLRMEGLDWGPDAPLATALGVRLVPKMTNAEYLRWLSTSDLVIGQATGILSVSELEAMAIGIPVVIPRVSLFPYPDGAPPPVALGSIGHLVEHAMALLVDPPDATEVEAMREWVRDHHTADPYVDLLQDLYRSATTMTP